MPTITKMDNGLIIIREKTSSPLISINVRVAVGSINENDPRLKGISHFVEHMVFNGTTTKTKDDITTKIENSGGNVNAYTNYGETVYLYSCQETNFEIALDTILSITNDATFPEDSIEKERSVILQEYFDYLDRPNSVGYENAYPEFFNETSFETSIIGTKESIKHITQKELVSYYNKFYRPERMIISVSGNFNQDIFNKYILKYFPNKNVKHDNIKNNLMAKPSKLEKTFPTKFENDNIFFYYDVDTKNYKEFITLQLISNYIGGGFSSVLFQKIREELGLVYRISSFVENTAGNTGMMIYTTCTKDKNETVIEETKKAIRNLEVTEKNFTEMKNIFLYEIYQIFDSSSSTAHRNLDSFVRYDNVYKINDIQDIVADITLEDFIDIAEKMSYIVPTIVTSKGKETDE